MNNENITKTFEDKMEIEGFEWLINLLKECKISDVRIMLVIFAIGTTEYYKVLYNRFNNQKEKIN